MPRLYRNIQNGREVTVSDRVFQKTIITLEEIERDFFQNYSDIIESYAEDVRITGTKLYTVKYRDVAQVAHILLGPLKNSGNGSPHKRLQVSAKTPVNESGFYFALGGYNTIDSHLYFAALQGIRGYILRARAGRTYSSLWFSYPSIFECYTNGYFEWTDKIDRDFIGCKKDNIRIIHDSIIEQLKGQGSVAHTVEGEQALSPLIDFSQEISKYRDEDVLPRNEEFRKIAIQRENYTCELCGVTETFINRELSQYFEGHHLIMYNPSVQRRYKYCLDHPDNIICLCPNCHRRIHNSSRDDTAKMLLDLFSKHKDIRSEFDVDDLRVVLDDYLNL